MASQDRTLFVTGHKNPDTDAVCSAIAYADYKRRTGTLAKAFRAGNLNAQTKHVLDRFALPSPPLLADVFPRVGDIMLGRGEIIVMHPDQPIADAYRIMLARRFSFLPVADSEDHCVGKISLLTLAKLLTGLGKGCSDEPKRYDLGNFIERTGSVDWSAAENRNDGSSDSGSGSRQNFSDGSSRGPVRRDWFDGELWSHELCGESEEERSSGGNGSSGANSRRRCIVVSVFDLEEGRYPAPARGDVLLVYGELERARNAAQSIQQGTPGRVRIICAPMNFIDLIVELNFSMPVSACIESPDPTFYENDMIREVEKQVNRYNHGGFIVLDEDGKLSGVLTRIILARTSRYLVALVDHNEYAQAVDGIEQADVAEIVDHHRLGARTTDQPITFINRVVGSTCTIIADMFRSARLTPTPEIAGCMLSAILSDTVILRSPTTTTLDREIAQDLAGLARVDLETWGEEMFAAGTDLHEMAPREIILQDQKCYEESEWRFAVSQIEMVGFKSFYEMKEDIAAALDAVRAEQGVQFACLLVSDIAKETSVLLFSGPDRVADAIGYPKLEANLFQLKGVLSRKKQLLPNLLDVVRAV